MSSLPRFEYDIFISYRHNDNRSGWVTDFVNALQEELAATIKEPLSIYFDKNPHDGLLETHDVDDSLKDKLKCRIFIPVISRTYCDPKSFAWNHEFLEYLKIASTDPLGIKIKLPNGNTASRVLPIRIHELDAHDRQAIEKELGPLRAIDFTYKAAGVNRPLLPKDDESIKASAQATYRDQINKTANAISDLLAGMHGNAPALRDAANDDIQAPTAPSLPRRNWKFKIPRVDTKSALIAALILSLLSLSVFHFSETPNDTKTYRSTLLPPEETIFAGGKAVLSPDGNTLAFVTFDSTRTLHLWVRPLNSLEARRLNGTEGAYFPFWSPDSRSIGFFADGKLKKIDVGGGVPQTLCDAVDARGGSWNNHGQIIFNGNADAKYNRMISLVSASGGKVVPITKRDTARGELSHRWPCFLPDGKHFLFSSLTSVAGDGEKDAIFLASLDSTAEPRMIAPVSSNSEYANGYLLFAHQQTLMAQPFDAETLQTLGEVFPIAENVSYSPTLSLASFSVSQNGHLVYGAGSIQSQAALAWLDRNGKQISGINQGKIFQHVRLSPDGERAVVSQAIKTEKPDIWLAELKRDAWTRFTFDAAVDRSPIWSPDGKTIVFASNRHGNFDLFQRASNGAGNEELLFQSPEAKIPTDWSRDGKYIVYHTLNPSVDIWILPVTLSPTGASKIGKPYPFLKTEFDERRATFSPDGRWIAYQSTESGRGEIYIRPFPGPGGKWQVSTDGGSHPRWRGDGKELFFAGTNTLMSAQVSLGDGAVQIGAVQTLFEISYVSSRNFGWDLYDVTRDGQRFLVEFNLGNAVSKPLTLVVNWPGEIKKN